LKVIVVSFNRNLFVIGKETIGKMVNMNGPGWKKKAPKTEENVCRNCSGKTFIKPF